MNMVPASKTASSIFHRQVDAQGFILAETAAISTRTVAPDWKHFTTNALFRLPIEVFGSADAMIFST